VRIEYPRSFTLEVFALLYVVSLHKVWSRLVPKDLAINCYGSNLSSQSVNYTKVVKNWLKFWLAEKCRHKL